MLQSFVRENGHEISRSEDLTKGGKNPLAMLSSANLSTWFGDQHLVYEVEAVNRALNAIYRNLLIH